MQIDIKGKINEKRLSYNNTLLPLFEAVVRKEIIIQQHTFTVV